MECGHTLGFLQACNASALLWATEPWVPKFGSVLIGDPVGRAVARVAGDAAPG